tara:strand:+ start:12642 stop:13133 length:492 start_codon:yes stop_codon:yes gene_type:complete
LKTYQVVEVKECNLITCDKCGVAADKEKQPSEFHEYLSITRNCGYSSGQDDGKVFEVDLCQRCSKELLGAFWHEKMITAKPTWDTYINESESTQAERADFCFELDKIRDSELPIGSHVHPGLVYASKRGRHFMELSQESVEFLGVNTGDIIKINVGDAIVTLS